MKFKRFLQGLVYFGSVILPFIDAFKGIKKGIQDNYRDNFVGDLENRRKFYVDNS